MNLKLRVDVLEALQKEKGWNDTELASRMGISRSRLWRTKLDVSHPEYCVPGERVITGLLVAFPERKFEDFFFLDGMCSEVHNEAGATKEVI